jgi:hypothetical protein
MNEIQTHPTAEQKNTPNKIGGIAVYQKYN